MIKALTVSSLLCITLAMTGCTMFSFQEEDIEENSALDASIDLTENEASAFTTSRTNQQNTPNLWVWIAPEYREQQADMQSEYIILPVQ